MHALGRLVVIAICLAGNVAIVGCEQPASGVAGNAPAEAGTSHGSDGNGTGGGGSFDAGTPRPDPNRSYAPTFEAVWNEILHPTCALEFCHGGDPTLVDLSSKERAYATLVGVPATGADCKRTGLLHVAPGKPDESLLYLKVTKPPCGSRMPPPYGTPPLDEFSVAQLRRWIERGAPNDSIWDGGLGQPKATRDASEARLDSGSDVLDAARD